MATDFKGHIWERSQNEYLLIYLVFSLKDGASTLSLQESLGGMGLSPSSLSWLRSSRPAGCCSAPSELPVGKRRTTIAISRLINRNHQGPQKVEVRANGIHACSPEATVVWCHLLLFCTNNINNLCRTFSHPSIHSLDLKLNFTQQYYTNNSCFCFPLN